MYHRLSTTPCMLVKLICSCFIANYWVSHCTRVLHTPQMRAIHMAVGSVSQLSRELGTKSSGSPSQYSSPASLWEQLYAILRTDNWSVNRYAAIFQLVRLTNSLSDTTNRTKLAHFEVRITERLSVSCSSAWTVTACWMQDSTLSFSCATRTQT